MSRKKVLFTGEIYIYIHQTYGFSGKESACKCVFLVNVAVAVQTVEVSRAIRAVVIDLLAAHCKRVCIVDNHVPNLRICHCLFTFPALHASLRIDVLCSCIFAN